MMDAMDKMDNQELISALADGQLRGEAFARAVQVAAADARAREDWCAYHVVGEVLRSGRAAVAGTSPEAFLARFQQRLAAEPSAVRAVAVVPVTVARPAPAANDWLWKMVAGFASVAAVTAVGWNLWGTTGIGGAQPQLASAPAVNAVVPVSTEAPGAMMRDPRLDQLLQAHRQLGGGTALGTTSGFLRNATFEGPAR
jgi:sigma-E factor negative regulatory protein RseA